MKYEYKKCVGCRTYREHKHQEKVGCKVIDWGGHKKCPCRICLVKSTCRASCKKFNSFMSELVESKKWDI